jgi:glycosyltransferase involved in cell wall biosynthesis
MTYLISVVIPCYNHGEFLANAIESVNNQDYPYKEIIVVDDGSTDNSKKIAKKYNVQYVYQPNQGLAAARNTGIENSKGDFLVFLDADDRLLDQALSVNYNLLKQHENAAFVWGTHKKVFNAHETIGTYGENKEKDAYCNLLKYGNYIEMHATVMFRRWVFDTLRYDTELKACEDYDLYLRITRNHPIIQHNHLIASYYIHESNMSKNSPMMLQAALKVLHQQKPFLRNEAEKKCLKKGIRFWVNFYCNLIYLKQTRLSENNFYFDHTNEFSTLWKYKKSLFFKSLIVKPMVYFKENIIKLSPSVFLRVLNKIGLYKQFNPKKGHINKGDFNRLTPFSNQFGYDRGGPVDRYYIENFLKKNSDAIKGKVLEIGDNDYTIQYGAANVSKSDVLHIDEQNDKATIIGDLSNAPHIADETYDCIILTQTLHLIYNFQDAIKTCYRILKPGGKLLLTVPGISHIDQGEWKDNWLWSFTEASIKKILSESFKRSDYEVQSYGNVLVAASFLYGLGKPELQKEQLDFHDPHYQVIITASATKS